MILAIRFDQLISNITSKVISSEVDIIADIQIGRVCQKEISPYKPI